MADTVRMQFDVSPTRLSELEDLMRLCQISTKKELINNALTLFEWAVKESESGNIIASLNEREKRYRELQMPSLATAARTARAHRENGHSEADSLRHMAT